MIPLPTSAENHQEMNARSIEEKKGRCYDKRKR
ncbi:MAG: hypothetical protein IPG09_16325 [Ignavibacteria bacterium]|nr:hypothetical protein [Ignavibacteria bacterium]